MKLLRTISLLFMCFALFAGSVANAAMPCCCFSADSKSEQAQADASDMDMPCHEPESTDGQQNVSCDSCDCVTCVKTKATNNEQSAVQTWLSSKYSFSQQRSSSRFLEGSFEPPKSNS